MIWTFCFEFEQTFVVKNNHVVGTNNFTLGHISMSFYPLDLPRDKLVAVAFLTGSDYTEGIQGSITLKYPGKNFS